MGFNEYFRVAGYYTMFGVTVCIADESSLMNEEVWDCMIERTEARKEERGG